MKLNNIYPSAQRPYDENESYKSRIQTEENITNIIKSIVDKPTFVRDVIGNNVKFILEGYYFDVELDSTPSDITAYALIAEDTNELYWADKTVLYINNAPTVPEGTHLISGVLRESGVWNMKKIEEKSIDFVAPKVIKCGVLR